MFLEVAAKRVKCSHPMIPNYQCLQVRERRYSESGGSSRDRQVASAVPVDRRLRAPRRRAPCCASSNTTGRTRPPTRRPRSMCWTWWWSRTCLARNRSKLAAGRHAAVKTGRNPTSGLWHSVARRGYPRPASGGLIFVMPSDGARMPESDDAMNAYPLFLILHLLAAFLFVGTVTFEVLFLEPVHKRLPLTCARRWAASSAARAGGVALVGGGAVPGGAGNGLAVSRRAGGSVGLAVRHPAVAEDRAGAERAGACAHRVDAGAASAPSGALSRRMHVSVFCHMVLIVVLAKAMFHVAW